VLIANTLYKIFAEKTKWFKDAKPKTISRNFIEVDSRINVYDDTIEVFIGKKCFNPVIMDWVNSLVDIRVSWWGNKLLKFTFE